MKIALIPIDNRPVCYNLIQEIAEIDKKLEIFLPDRNFLGRLKSKANIKGIFDWLDKLEEVDAIVVSLDTIAYGGLVSSRRCKDSINDIKRRLEKFKEKLTVKSNKIYAFSSIMRISNNNENEEEKEYWSEYGQQIFEYSYNFHKYTEETTEVPNEILNDYLATRQRNFEINKMYLKWLEEGFFNTLIFSKDDCAEFGLNVFESEILKKTITEKKLSAFVKTGADEIPMTLLARAICDAKNTEAPKISTRFLAPDYKHLISNYEDISIRDSVNEQIELSGCRLVEEDDSDIILIVNNFEINQGELVTGVKTKGFSGSLSLVQKPFAVADVRFANGADNQFAEKLLKKFSKGINFNNFYGYSAWNTSTNTLGSLICAAVVRFLAADFNEKAFKTLQIIRFLDDWAYQANVRQSLKNKAVQGNSRRKMQRPDVGRLKKQMIPYEKKLSKIFKMKIDCSYKFPWRRFFEVEVIIK